jgi:hypothetical protein
MRKGRTAAPSPRRASTATTSATAAITPTGGVAVRSNHHPWFILILGVAFLALWVIGIMTQVQTNEAFITASGQVNLYKPNWEIFMQIPNLVLGFSSAQEGSATLFGWGIELIYLGFVVGAELLHDAAARSGQTMAGIFKSLSYAIVVFNGWTDYNYGSFGSGIGGHLLFACIMSFIVGFFGTIGMYLIESAWSRV